MEIKGFFQFAIFINVLVSSFWSFEYLDVMGLRPLQFLNSFSAGTAFRRQKLTSVASFRA